MARIEAQEIVEIGATDPDAVLAKRPTSGRVEAAIGPCTDDGKLVPPPMSRSARSPRASRSPL
jgi:hypothetical protein